MDSTYDISVKIEQFFFNKKVEISFKYKLTFHKNSIVDKYGRYI